MKPQPPHYLSKVHRGFTLIELLVTLGILLVMLGLINFIFRDTQRAVSLGIETGEVIAAQRGMASQIRRDFEQMVGPHQGNRPDTANGGGFLVLTQDLAGDTGVGGAIGVTTASLTETEIQPIQTRTESSSACPRTTPRPTPDERPSDA